MTYELSPEHQAIAEEARERVKRYMNRLSIIEPVQFPGEVSDDRPEGKN